MPAAENAHGAEKSTKEDSDNPSTAPDEGNNPEEEAYVIPAAQSVADSTTLPVDTHQPVEPSMAATIPSPPTSVYSNRFACSRN